MVPVASHEDAGPASLARPGIIRSRGGTGGGRQALCRRRGLGRPPGAPPLRAQRALRIATQAPAKAMTPMTALRPPRMAWLPWCTLPDWPIESSGPMFTPAKNRIARMTNTAPMTARAMTSGRLEPAPPEKLAELTSSSFGGRDSPRAVVRLLESGFPDDPAGGPRGGERLRAARYYLRLMRMAYLMKTSENSFGFLESQPDRPGAAVLPGSFPARAQEVADHVLTQAVRQRAQYPPAVPPRHLVNEAAQPLVVGQHEDVQRCPPPRHLVYLGHGQLERFRRRRPVER